MAGTRKEWKNALEAAGEERRKSAAELARVCAQTERACEELRLRRCGDAVADNNNGTGGYFNLQGKEDAELDALLGSLQQGLRAVHRAKETQMRSQTERLRCVICRDAAKQVLLYPCMHLCMCKECAEQNRRVTGAPAVGDVARSPTSSASSSGGDGCGVAGGTLVMLGKCPICRVGIVRQSNVYM